MRLGNSTEKRGMFEQNQEILSDLNADLNGTQRQDGRSNGTRVWLTAASTASFPAKTTEEKKAEQRWAEKFAQPRKANAWNLDAFSIASLSALWATSEESLALFGDKDFFLGQDLSNITNHIWSEETDPSADEPSQLLEGLNAFQAFGGEVLLGLAPILLIAASCYIYQYYKASNNSHLAVSNSASRLALGSSAFMGLGIVGSKVLGYASAKVLLGVAAHAITFTSPWMHIPLGLMFATAYALIATLSEYLLLYTVKQRMMGGEVPTNFTAFLQKSVTVGDFRQSFSINFMSALGFYCSTIIPGLNFAESAVTSVAMATGAGLATRCAWQAKRSGWKETVIMEDDNIYTAENTSKQDVGSQGYSRSSGSYHSQT